MSGQDAGFTGGPSGWNPNPWQAPPPVRHGYGLAVRDHGLATACGLLMRSLPYALVRFAVLLGYAIACIVWLAVAFGGAAWLGTHIAAAFGVGWFVLCAVGVGWFWGAVLRYTLHLLACGHVAVLTELIVHGQVRNADQSMLTYGKRVVLARFGEVNALFGLNMLVRGILNAFHRSMDWIAGMVPVPGLESLSGLINVVLRAATRYLDKVILSYNLARDDGDPWRGAREGLVYYAQNARPILQTSLWTVILERVLSFILWLLLLAPAAGITLMLPQAAREIGGLATFIIAALLAGTVRAAFIKPLFLIMMMVRFHALVENQPINEEWDARLAGLSNRFRDLGTGLAPAPV